MVMVHPLLVWLQETSRRLLHFAVPRVIAVSPQMRLVEDNASSLSLLDIYRQVGPPTLTLTLSLSLLDIYRQVGVPNLA